MGGEHAPGDAMGGRGCRLIKSSSPPPLDKPDAGANESRETMLIGSELRWGGMRDERDEMPGEPMRP